MVKWGDQRWEEMMIGWVGVVVDANADPAKVVKRPPRQQAPAAD
jgi:hypothetical protein